MSRRKKRSSPLPEPAIVGSTPAIVSSKPPLESPIKSAYGGFALAAAFCLGIVVATLYAKNNFAKTDATLEPKAIATIPMVAILPQPTATTQPIFKQPTTLEELLDLPTADLGKVDLATMNLLCAEGLPGSENLNISQCLATL